MITDVVFHPSAFRSWVKLDPAIQAKFAIKLKERMEAPENPKDRLAGPLSKCFKTRLIAEGYRLVYEPHYQNGALFVRSVGRRDQSVYINAVSSLADS